MAVELPPVEAPLAAIEAPALERTEAAPAAATSRKPKVAKRAKPWKAAKAEVAPTVAEAVRAAVDAAKPATEAKALTGGGCRGEVYNALKTGPATTPALVKRFEPSYSGASVYLALKELRAAGVVRTKLENGEQTNSLLT